MIKRLESIAARHDNHILVRFQSFRRFCDARQDIIPAIQAQIKIQLKLCVLHDNIIIN